MSWIRWPGGRARFGYGADYNPEQWEPAVWRDDVALMQRAGVTIATVAVFGWSFLEPAPGEFDFSLYDEVLDLLHAGGIAVDLATGTASPPAWLVEAHPEMRPVTSTGVRLEFGARQSWCPSSPIYREHSLRLTEAMARHYAGHPALALWHVSNELGCHNARCYCDTSRAAFQAWLVERYRTLDALNHAWGTAFWSQRYTEWRQIPVPRAAPASQNPAAVLDFHRFSSDELRGQLVAEGDVIRRFSDVPVTTNFMVMGDSQALDHARWADDVDLVANDHYLQESESEQHVELALAADTVRGLADGGPWMLMEAATSAVNWGSVNSAKHPGQLRLDMLSQVARGADAICFFQWRQSLSGAEKFHSAMLPHAGPDTRVFSEVAALGADLARLTPVLGSTVRSQVGLLFDYEAWWAAEGEGHPRRDFRYRQVALAYYRALWGRGLGVDVLFPHRHLDRLGDYRLVVAPALHLVDDATAAALRGYVAAGGTLMLTYNSAVVDPDDRVWSGGAPGPLADVLGIRVEEVLALAHGETVALTSGASAGTWTEDLRVARDVDVLDRAAEGPLVGGALVTRRGYGEGTAWYVGADLDAAGRDRLLAELIRHAEVAPPAVGPGLELTERRSADGTRYLFALNRGSTSLALDVEGEDLLTGVRFGGVVAAQTPVAVRLE